MGRGLEALGVVLSGGGFEGLGLLGLQGIELSEGSVESIARACQGLLEVEAWGRRCRSNGRESRDLGRVCYEACRRNESTMVIFVSKSEPRSSAFRRLPRSSAFSRLNACRKAIQTSPCW